MGQGRLHVEERRRGKSPGKQVEMKWLLAMREGINEQWDAFRAKKHQVLRKHSSHYVQQFCS